MDSNPNMASEAAEDAEAFLPPVIGEYCKYPNNQNSTKTLNIVMNCGKVFFKYLYSF